MVLATGAATTSLNGDIAASISSNGQSQQSSNGGTVNGSSNDGTVNGSSNGGNFSGGGSGSLGSSMSDNINSSTGLVNWLH